MKYMKLNIKFLTLNALTKIKINSFKNNKIAKAKIFFEYTQIINPIINGKIVIVSYLVFFFANIPDS